MKLVVVSAGLSVPSSTRLLGDRLAAAVVERARATGPDGAEAGVEVRVVEVRDLAVDIAHHLTTGFPGPALGAALSAVADADGLIVVTPVFSASYSGLFKSFFDVLDRDALAGKPVLVAATGGSARHSLVLEHAMRPLFAYLRAVVVPTAVYAASEDWGAEGLAERIERAAGELSALVPAGGSGGSGGSGAGRWGVAGDGDGDGVDTAPYIAPVRAAAAAAPVPAPTPVSVPAVAPTPVSVPGRAAGAVRVGGFEVVPFADQLAALRPE